MEAEIWTEPEPDEKNMVQVWSRLGGGTAYFSLVWKDQIESKMAEKTAWFESFGHTVKVVDHKPFKFE